jgi:phosphatidylglycerophosphate synthase
MSLKQWNIIHSIAILLALAVFHLTGWYWPAVTVAFLSVILLWTSQWYTISNIKPAGGYANLLTLLRYNLILLIVLFSDIWPLWSLGLLFAIPLMLDGLDGYLARKLNHTTRFGALFDLETDSIFMTFTGMILYHRNIVGGWLLPAAYMRYFYVLIIALLQLNRIQEKRTRFGPFIAFIMFVSLILEFLFQSAFTRVSLFCASCLIVLSFIYSFFGVISQRRDV